MRKHLRKIAGAEAPFGSGIAHQEDVAGRVRLQRFVEAHHVQQLAAGGVGRDDEIIEAGAEQQVVQSEKAEDAEHDCEQRVMPMPAELRFDWSRHDRSGRFRTVHI